MAICDFLSSQETIHATLNIRLICITERASIVDQMEKIVNLATSDLSPSFSITISFLPFLASKGFEIIICWRLNGEIINCHIKYWL